MHICFSISVPTHRHDMVVVVSMVCGVVVAVVAIGVMVRRVVVGVRRVRQRRVRAVVPIPGARAVLAGRVAATVHCPCATRPRCSPILEAASPLCARAAYAAMPLHSEGGPTSSTNIIRSYTKSNYFTVSTVIANLKDYNILKKISARSVNNVDMRESRVDIECSSAAGVGRGCDVS